MIQHHAGKVTLLRVSARLFTRFQIQIIVGGKATYSEEYSKMCAQRMLYLRSLYPDNFWADPNMFFTGVFASVSMRICSFRSTDGALVNLGADFGLMPSAFEPGGVVQHEFFAV